MAEEATGTTPKIEELRGRLKADPKSRHFYPLAEELRKIHQLEEAEQILREGIQTHATYLSAWISLGRVLRDRSRDHEAVEVLKRALELDPGNVVAAKLLAQAYLGIGDKVEAIKKFKLVFALMPSDEDVEESIRQLDRELNPDKYASPPGEVQEAIPAPVSIATEPEPFEVAEDMSPAPTGSPFIVSEEPSRFDSTDPVPFGFEEEPFGSTADSALPSSIAAQLHGGKDNEGPLSGSGGEVAAHVDAQASPLDSEVEPFGDIGDVGAPSVLDGLPASAESRFESTQPFGETLPPPPQQMPATMTMAQLYESQGHEQQAAEVYRQILEQHPDHELARVALMRAAAPSDGALSVRGDKQATIARLKQWRERVTRT